MEDLNPTADETSSNSCFTTDNFDAPAVHADIKADHKIESMHLRHHSNIVVSCFFYALG